MARNRRQVIITLVGLLLIVVVLAAFRATAEVTEVPDRGGTYVEGIAGFPQAINPILAQDDSSRTLAALIFSGLTRSDDRGLFVPDLAERWEVDEEGMSYTFWIRPDARWHDGQPVTAADVLYTVKTLQDPAYTGLLGSAWQGVTAEALDERTVRFQIGEGPLAPFLEQASVGLLPAHLLGDVAARDLPAHRFNTQPIGTGPFRLVEAHPDALLLAANPSYYGPRPYLDQILFRVYPNYKTILTALARGEVEAVAYVAPEDVGRALTVPHIQLHQGLLANTTILFLNVTAPPFNDRRVRRAVAYALDRGPLIERARMGHARRADSPIPTASWAYLEGTPRYEYDPNRAQALLDEAGWRLRPENPQDRRRFNSAGEPLRVVLLTNNRQERLRLAAAIAEQLQAVGIGIEVQALGAGGLVQDFLRPRRYQAALFSWDFNGLDPDPYTLWHSSQREHGLNVTGFQDQRIDALLDQARRTTDPGERAELYHEFQVRFAEEVPSVLLYHPVYIYAVSARVQGVRLGLMAGPADRFRNVHEWYIRTRREITRRQ